MNIEHKRESKVHVIVLKIMQKKQCIKIELKKKVACTN
jgi:hypothetical protein